MDTLIYKKAKLYKGQALKGAWEITLKLDGVRAIRNPVWKEGSSEPKYISRNSKPLHNLDHLDFLDAEIFSTNWEQTISLVRTHNGNPVPEEFVYSLDYGVDERLSVTTVSNPTEEYLDDLLLSVVADGYEGLVLRQEGKWLKHKTVETFDVPIIGYQAGAGKHVGRMGALLTPMGKVGTGFKDYEREEFQKLLNEGSLLGLTIEVECMELTPSGNFRHPRFKRLRLDKDS